MDAGRDLCVFCALVLGSWDACTHRNKVPREDAAPSLYPKHDGQVFEAAMCIRKKFRGWELWQALEKIIDWAEYWPSWRVELRIPRSKSGNERYLKQHWFALPCGAQHLKVHTHFQFLDPLAYSSAKASPRGQASLDEKAAPEEKKDPELCGKINKKMILKAAAMPNITELSYRLNYGTECADAISSTIYTGCSTAGRQYTQTPWLAIACESLMSSYKKDVIINVAVHYRPRVDFFHGLVVRRDLALPVLQWTQLKNMLDWTKFCESNGGASRIWLTSPQWERLVSCLPRADRLQVSRGEVPQYLRQYGRLGPHAFTQHLPQWSSLGARSNSVAYFFIVSDDDGHEKLEKGYRGLMRYHYPAINADCVGPCHIPIIPIGDTV